MSERARSPSGAPGRRPTSLSEAGLSDPGGSRSARRAFVLVFALPAVDFADRQVERAYGLAPAVTAAVGPVAAAVIDVVHPGLRATAVSLLVVVQGVCGLAVGPVLAGALADRWGLTAALAVIPALGVVAAGALRWGSRSCADDRAAAALTPGMPDPVVGRATGGEG